MDKNTCVLKIIPSKDMIGNNEQMQPFPIHVPPFTAMAEFRSTTDWSQNPTEKAKPIKKIYRYI